MANFHDIFESLPGIVTTYEVNLLKTKVCNNLRLFGPNVNTNIHEIARAMLISVWPLTKVYI